MHIDYIKWWPRPCSYIHDILDNLNDAETEAATINELYYELKRRRVIRVIFIYAVVGWGLIVGAAELEEILDLPDWTDRLVLLLIGLGLPLIIILAWIFDITPQGIERTADSKSEQQPIGSRSTGIDSILGIDNSVASICVLPFDDLSPERDQDWMAEGLSSEIHSTLVRMHRVRVASRRLSAQRNPSNQSVQDIGRELNAKYVLSGSLTRMGDRIRVNAELDDAESGSQIWSERYERSVDDLLAVQADIAEKIVSAFGVERQRLEITGVFKAPTENMDAWGTVQRARRYILDYSQESLDEAKRSLKRAVDMDPDYAAAHATLGSVLVERVLNGFSDDAGAERSEALMLVERAQQLSAQDPFVLKMSGMVLAVCGQTDESIRCLRACVELAPYDFGGWGYFGWPLAARGTAEDFEELHRIVDHLLSSAPDHPGAGYWFYHKSAAYLSEGDLDAAESNIRRALDKHPSISWAWMHLASILGAQGKSEEARKAAAKAQKIHSAMTPQHFASCLEAMSGPHGSACKRVSGLEKAGLFSA